MKGEPKPYLRFDWLCFYLLGILNLNSFCNLSVYTISNKWISLFNCLADSIMCSIYKKNKKQKYQEEKKKTGIKNSCVLQFFAIVGGAILKLLCHKTSMGAIKG